MPPEIWAVVTYLLQSTGAAVLTILAFIGLAPTKLGERFLNHHLERKLADLTHRHDQEMEKLRADLAHLGDRGVRSNQREFEALTAAWERFVDAYIAAHACVLRYIEYPDFRGLSDEDAVSYLASSGLSDGQQKNVLEAEDRNKAYTRFVTLNLIADARTAIWEARSVLRKQGIFIPEALKKSFEDACGLFSRAQVAMQVQFNHPPYDGLKEIQALLNEGPKVFDDLQAAVRKQMYRG